jgi:hypothetical protein
MTYRSFEEARQEGVDDPAYQLSGPGGGGWNGQFRKTR